MAIERMTATALLEALEARRLSSVEIVRALTERADLYAERVNCFSQPRHEQALEEAEAADEARASGRELGALHGLPVTIKDNVDVAGLDSTLGIAARVGRPASKDAAVVASLRAQGAIVLAKTNVPQLLLAQETNNPIWGLTRNPWHLGRSAGGSSGGEAAAIAAGLSPCGIGTDIGGSIRIPAHFCGLAGLKPTVDRWSNRGSNGAATGQEMVRSQIGPLARSSSDLADEGGLVDQPRRGRPACSARCARRARGGPGRRITHRLV
jgi:fatty acid amide hydrolase